MEYDNTVFFVRDKALDAGPKVKIQDDRSGEDYGWPFTLKIYTKEVNTPEIKVFMRSEFQLINFVNSAKESLAAFRKERA